MQGQIVVLTGGVAVSDEGTSPVQVFLVQEDVASNKVKWMELPMSVDTIATMSTDGGGSSSSGPILDMGCLVHHSQVILSDNKPTSTLAVIGGGVTSFAFGDSFAASYLLEVVLDDGVGTDDSSISTSRTRIQQTVPTASRDDVSCTKDSEHAPSASTTTRAVPTISAASSTPVVYVLPKDAKVVKDQLDQKGWLDKGFRMISVVDDGDGDDDENDGKRGRCRIAIPIRSNASSAGGGGGGGDPRLLDPTTWKDHPQILEVGVRDDMPLSTARFAAHNPSRRGG